MFIGEENATLFHKHVRKSTPEAAYGQSRLSSE